MERIGARRNACAVETIAYIAANTAGWTMPSMFVHLGRTTPCAVASQRWRCCRDKTGPPAAWISARRTRRCTRPIFYKFKPDGAAEGQQRVWNATDVPVRRWGPNSPGDRSSNGGPNQGSSGWVCRGGTEKIRTGEGNTNTVSLPPHHLTIALLEIA